MVKKMPLFITFLIFLLVLNVLLLGANAVLKNTTPEKCIDNVIKDVLENNISNYEKKDELEKVRDIFDEFKNQELNYADRFITYDKDKKIYYVLIVFRKGSLEFKSERIVELTMKIKRRFFTYQMEDVKIRFFK